MEAAAEQLASRDLRQGETGSRVKRRLVQSTLLPQVTKERDYNAEDYKDEEDEEGIKDEKEEDWCNSSEKRQRKSSKGKTNSNSKVTVNGKEVSNRKTDSKHSPVFMKSDFFMKISEKRQQKGQQEDQLCIVSHEENDISRLSPNSTANIKTPQHLKQQSLLELDKQQNQSSTTPKKKVVNDGAKKSLFKRLPSKSAEKQTVQFSPNLRSEAKMTAEENSRLSAGRPIHPFFSSWKVNKKNQEIIEMDNAWCSLEGKDESTSFNPIHVFEADKDGASSLDWGDLTFSQESFPNFNSGLGSVSVISERCVNSLQFDDFPTICYPSTTSTYQNKMSLDQCPYELNEENEIDRFDSINQVSSSCLNSDADWKSNCFQQGNYNVPENSLWTDKYQPRKAAEICGNGASVKFISEWLCLWHEKGSLTRKSSFEGVRTVEDVDFNCSLSDADSENTDGETSLKNVLLVTGPVGSGKSAAIYACAEEQGFQIIEVNASDWRNGALVKQRFGEALESHWLQHKADNTVHPEMKPPVKPVPGTKVNEGSKSEVVELIQLSDEEDSQQAYQNSCRSICRQNMEELKTLIFFEDVDATLSEDHGFLSMIQQLAQTAKRPIILTANKYNPALPHNLDRLEVQFRMPSLKELFSLGHVVCVAENAQIDSSLIDRFIEYCQSDIRKTIMHLQFWCQSQNSQKGNGAKLAYSPSLFDLEAGHQSLPKLISWNCPSRLSELIEEEITKSLMMEESNNLVEIVVEEEMNERERQNSSRICGTISDCNGTKKEEMLMNLNYSLQVDDELLSQPHSNSQFSDISCSPVAFARRNVRARFDTVISSDSEEANSHDGTPFSGCVLIDTNCRIQGVKSNSPSHSFAIERCSLPNEQFSPFDECNLEQRSIGCSETAVFPCVDSMSNLAEVSSVPESSAVLETEAINEIGLFSAAVSYSPHVCRDVDSMRYYLSPSFSLNECDKSSEPIRKDIGTPGSYSDSDKTNLHGEVVGDSHIVHEEDAARLYQDLDDCSSCAFARIAKNFEKPTSHCQFNNVEETWQRLRNCRMDLKQHITPEQKDVSLGLRLAFGMTDLISEADLLVSYCQPHVYDLLESSVSLQGKTHSHRWYDDQLQMSSIVFQHGICFYAKEASVLGSNRSCCDRVDLALEMLLSSTNAMSLAKLLTLDKKLFKSMDLRTPIKFSRRSCKNNSSLCNVLQSVVSSRAYLALQGNAFHEYLSSLSQISRSETLQSSECFSQRKQRRRRGARHYLSSGSYSLSPEDISLLNQCNSYGKVCCQSEDSWQG